MRHLSETINNVQIFINEELGIPPLIPTYSLILCILYFILDFICANFVDFSRNEKLKENHQPVVNKLVASFHAAVLFALTIGYWFFMGNIFAPPPNTTNNMQMFCIDIMLGYLIYDTLFDTIWELKNQNNQQMMAHHLLGAFSLGAIRYLDSAPGAHYNMIVFLAEASTPALHSSWIMKELKFTKTWAYQLVGWTLVGLFFIFRIILAPFLVFKVWNEKEAWRDQPPYFFEINFAIVVFFMFINFFWFKKLIAMAIKTGTKAGEAKTKKTL
jgi:hypothetical protein